MSADALLQRLEGVQRSGEGWRARCPACGGKSRKLSVREIDGWVTPHCFGGCARADILQAVGMELHELGPERPLEHTPDGRRRRRGAAREAGWGAALEVLEFEATIVAIVGRELQAGKPQSEEDRARLALALERIEAARDELRERPKWRPTEVRA